jgi:hypothetical protein
MRAGKKQINRISGYIPAKSTFWIVWIDCKIQARALTGTVCEKWETFEGSAEKYRILNIFLMF